MKTLTVESLAKENAKNKNRIGERERERKESKSAALLREALGLIED